jgi:alanyl aminopeptidase
MELFQAFLAEARKASDRRERTRLLDALGHFRDPSVVPAALALTLSPDFDARESIAVLREAAREGDQVTREGALAFLKANFDRLAERLPRDDPAWFPWLASRFSDAAHRAEVEAFFKDRAANYAGGPRELAQALEVIQLRTALKASQQESVNDFLKSYPPRPTIDVRPQPGM